MDEPEQMKKWIAANPGPVHNSTFGGLIQQTADPMVVIVFGKEEGGFLFTASDGDHEYVGSAASDNYPVPPGEVLRSFNAFACGSFGVKLAAQLRAGSVGGPGHG